MSGFDWLAQIRAEFDRLHDLYNLGVDDLTPEQWHALPAPQTNHIGFVVWHYTRTEDNIVRFVLQGRPTVWMEGGWAERLGLPPKGVQGTGMSLAEAQALRIRDPEGFKAYMRRVWAATGEFLDRVDDETLSRKFLIKPLGELLGGRALLQVCLCHGYSHLGELTVARSLLGLPRTTSI